MPIRRTTMAAVAVAAVFLAGCGDASDSAGDAVTTAATGSAAAAATSQSSTPSDIGTNAGSDDQQFPDVLEAEVTASGDTWSVAATISSPYDSPERYADAFRVLGPDGTELGIRELTHDHANEQPFTRSLADVIIPDDVNEVTIEGRDQVNGWGGDTVTIAVPR